MQERISHLPFALLERKIFHAATFLLIKKKAERQAAEKQKPKCRASPFLFIRKGLVYAGQIAYNERNRTALPRASDKTHLKRKENSVMKHILLIATGGTIASGNSENGLTPQISSEELLSYVPAAREFCTIDAVQILNIDSTNLQPEHWLLMARTVRENYDKYDGFVICHGTDTMAYTSSALSYLIQNSPKPIIITGAQKPISMEITDAKTNLLDSLRFAACPDAHGVTIVFNGKIIAGTRAKKVHSKSFNAFDSINFPVLATIRNNKIVHYVKDSCPCSYPAFYSDINPKVCLVKLIPGMEPDLLPWIGEHYDAVIIESYGVGGLPSAPDRDFLKEVDKLIADGKIVVMTTQVMYEGSDMEVYEVGHVAKERYGLIESYDMTLEATVTKLMWIMAQTHDPQRIKAMFYTTINHDILFQNN